MNFIEKLEKIFAENKNELQAKKQASYMRNQFSFLGIPVPLRKALQKTLLRSSAIQEEKILEEILRALWSKEQREFQYAALDIADSFKKRASMEMFKTYERMIRTKSWWDTVDMIAATLIGHLLLTYPELIQRMDHWIQDENLWIRRTALIYQLKWRKQTDEKRLFSYCEKVMHEKDFFIRKAIGWALRQYSKIEPNAVRKFITKNQHSLSPLSIKEGSKYV